MFDELIEKNKFNLLESVSELIKIPSVSSQTNDPKLPFGKPCADALDYMLNLGNQMGFRTKNIDGYCGYIEFGEGEELVGIIGHLDVVPALEEDGWTSPPFFPVIRDGKLFGRGSIDDKGPVIASLYAMKAIKDSISIKKRVRLILGLNEEKDWNCINYYKTKEEFPIIGFSPDANFPAIYAEKGIMSIILKNNFGIKNFSIINFDCKNNAINVVPKYASITMQATSNSLLTLKSTSEITISNLENSTIKIEAFGTAAHAAHPELGKNAIKLLIEYLLNNFEFTSNYLKTLFEIGLFDIQSPKFLSENKLEDESGILTSNVAVIEYENNKLVLKINLRVPVTISLNEIFIKYETLKRYFPSIKLEKSGIQEHLYIEKDSYLVKTLVDIFNKKTNQNLDAIAIGGGTYARAFKNFISYGLTFPGDKDMCHQVDEFIEVDKLILASKIYAEAIYELAK